jgi:hypothetical protein
MFSVETYLIMQDIHLCIDLIAVLYSLTQLYYIDI